MTDGTRGGTRFCASLPKSLLIPLAWTGNFPAIL